jgi:hypothetical protein
MPTYTVHTPARQGATDPEKVVFLRDGFHGWAFVAPPLWLLVHWQWLALLGYAIFVALLVVGLVWLGAGATAIIGAALCVSLLVGLEAATIRRWTLTRRGWAMLGFVVGEDRNIAEQRFFARWAERPQPAPAETARAPDNSVPLRRGPERDVIGLFPSPDRAR